MSLDCLVVHHVQWRAKKHAVTGLTPVELEGLAPENFVFLCAAEPLTKLDEIADLCRENWLFHVRAPIGGALSEGRACIPRALDLFFVSKKAVDADAISVNGRPFPHPEVDDPAQHAVLADYPFCRMDGGMWDLMSRAGEAEEKKDFAGALKLLKAAFELDSINGVVCARVGMCYIELGREDEAERWLQRARDLDQGGGPDLASANLGVIYTRRAEAAMAAGDKARAYNLVLLALFYADDREVMWLSAALVAMQTGNMRSFFPAFKVVANTHKGEWGDLTKFYCCALNSLGMIGLIPPLIPHLGPPEEWTGTLAAIVSAALQQTGSYKAAKDVLRAVKNHDANTVNLLTGMLFDFGDINAAMSHHNQAWCLVSKAEDTLLCNGVNRVFTSNYHIAMPEVDIFDVHRQWGAAMMELVPPSPVGDLIPTRRTSGDRVVVGFIGGDFREHAVMMFAWCLFAYMDMKKYDVHVFAGNPMARQDEVTRGITSSVGGPENFHWIHEMTADEAAAFVRSLGVQILVDLSGHTSGTKLNVLARRPAPIQVSMIGYPNTTGLPRGVMNYRVVDSITDPVGSGADELHTEQLLRVSECFLCYCPPLVNCFRVPLPPAARDPSLGLEFVFGCYAKVPKISALVWEAWAQILKRAPRAILRLKSKIFSDQYFAEEYRKTIQTAHQIDKQTMDRVIFSPYRGHPEQHLRDYALMDAMLDTFPYSGTTTTCEALSMGVPVLTLYGEMHRQNVSASIIVNSDLPVDWVCRSSKEYVDKAVAFASGSFGSRPLDRETVRKLFFQGSVCKSQEYVKKIEEEVFQYILK